MIARSPGASVTGCAREIQYHPLRPAPAFVDQSENYSEPDE